MRERAGHRRGHGAAGQSAVEYAVLIAALVGALITMQIYVKRAVSGSFRESSDSIGDQYSARHMRGDKHLTLQSKVRTDSKLFMDVDLDGVNKVDVMLTDVKLLVDTSFERGREELEEHANEPYWEP